MSYENKAIRQAANGAPCLMRSPDCNYQPHTVVLCHSNKLIHGKGRGIKADDRCAFFGCSACHAWFDGATGVPESVKDQYFARAMALTHAYLLNKHIIQFEELDGAPCLGGHDGLI